MNDILIRDKGTGFYELAVRTTDPLTNDRALMCDTRVVLEDDPSIQIIGPIRWFVMVARFGWVVAVTFFLMWADLRFDLGVQEYVRALTRGWI